MSMPIALRTASASSHAPSARAIALSALTASVKSDEEVDVFLDRALTASRLDQRERALAMELAYGVLRRQGTIDWRLQPVTDKPLSRLPMLVQMILRLGAYQLLFLDRIPASAAVNESVQLAKMNRRLLGRDWSGFVNAVLRSLLREPAPPWPAADLNPVQALAVRHSVPEWLSRRWIERVGLDAAERLCERSSSTPPTTLRVNRLKTTRETLLTRFAQSGIAARATSISPVGILLDEGGAVASLPGFQEGAFYIEDEAAQLVPPLLDPQPGEVVLDACAAPGGKATHLAELMRDKGTIVAIDRSASRLELLSGNCSRLNIKSIEPIVADVRKMRDKRFFDRILVDAPCSGLGVLRRHPDAKWRKDAQAFSRHHALQMEILRAVGPRLRAGGVLVYSTCSTEREENETVIEQFCRSHAEFRRESVSPWLPAPARRFLNEPGDLSTMAGQHSMDGFYAARLIKDESWRDRC